MGSKSNSKQSQDTSNQSTTFGIQGDNTGSVINGSGNVVTAGGAFDIVNRIVDMFPGLANVVTDMTMSGERQTENVLNAAVDNTNAVLSTTEALAKMGRDSMTEAGQVVGNVTESAFDYGTQAMRSVQDSAALAMDSNLSLAKQATDANTAVTTMAAKSLENANNNTADLASRSIDNSAMLAGDAMDNAAYLAEVLSKTALDSGNAMQKDTTQQLITGFQGMMDFANSYSRSDGADLAKANNQTLLYMGGGFGVLMIIMLFVVIYRGKK
ncbi:hypothetical protein [Shewanella fodinae]|jgi:hypothetical protein|uniref:Uncharacterized protein n=1 Tax=Shewanella fodinae TaxID=552357 RepID=A0A4R2F0U7_9GAMM|nr:hypothetical protein [Shewanella fodinae]MDN5369593.1 hypothetical protein [Shewanella sp.]TCN77714.1 hypothetical protein EDC91_14415 [Shewanella fodinae]